MKFLLGLILGGAITVVAAERIAANGPEWRDSRARAWFSWVQAAVVRAERAWVDSDDHPAALPADPVAEAAAEHVAALSPGVGPDELAEWSQAGDMREPMAQLAGPEPMAPAEGPEPLPAAEDVLPFAGPPAVSAPEAIQQVWAPFRSQTSAEGFARRLSSETDHPFGIDRRGPGRYQVFFAYADEDERRRLLEQVRPLIGTAAP